MQQTAITELLEHAFRLSQHAPTLPGHRQKAGRQVAGGQQECGSWLQLHPTCTQATSQSGVWAGLSARPLPMACQMPHPCPPHLDRWHTLRSLVPSQGQAKNRHACTVTYPTNDGHLVGFSDKHCKSPPHTHLGGEDEAGPAPPHTPTRAAAPLTSFATGTGPLSQTAVQELLCPRGAGPCHQPGRGLM